MIEKNNNQIEFWDNETKVKILKFKIRLTKSTPQLKEEQINLSLEDIEKNLEEYKKPIALRDNQIAEAKKYFWLLKKSYDSVVQENQHLEQYIKNIKKVPRAPATIGTRRIFQRKKLFKFVQKNFKFNPHHKI